MSKFAIHFEWADTPHLDDAAKADLLSSYLPHEREARTRGVASLGAGAIYPISEDEILCDPIEFPLWYRFVYALDVGWNRTAALWGAIDPETDILYLYSEYYRGQAEPPIHAEAIRSRGRWIPGVIDPAARGRTQDDGTQLLTLYQDLGLTLTIADNSVESGIYKTWTRMSTGKLKVFRTLGNFLAEFRLYRRDEKGKIVKVNDHLMDCFDPETEVLTSEGWLKFNDLTGHEPLATVNLRTDLIEYQFPQEIIKRYHKGDMVRFGGHKLDGLVTPNHRMVVYPRDQKRPTIRHAHELKVWDRLKLNGIWKGVERQAVKVEKAYGREAEIDPLVWAEFLGWYVAEGSYYKTVQIPGRGYSVMISQKTPEKVEHLRQLLAKTPWKWRYYENNATFVTSCQWLWEYVSPLGDKYQKYAPAWVKRSEPRVIEAFLRGAVMGDGWVQPNGARAYCSVSKRLADDVQELFIKTGVSASVLLGRKGKDDALVFGKPTTTVDQYWVLEWRSPYGLLRDSTNKPNFDRVPYEGMVYCATVPNGTLIVRRNGKPMIAGNCARYLCSSGVEIATQRPADQWFGRTVNGIAVGRPRHQSDYNPLASAWSPQGSASGNFPSPQPAKAPNLWMPHTQR